MPILTLDQVVQLVQPYSGQYAGDQTFLGIVASGAKAESGWNTDAIQPGGGAMGLFQFDPGGMGKGLSASQLTGMAGAQFEAAKIVPLYAESYAQGLARGLSGQNLATYVIGAAEKPHGWTPGAVQWSSPYHTWENYVAAFKSVFSGVPGQIFVPPVTGGGTTAPPIVAQPPAQGGTQGQSGGTSIPGQTVLSLGNISGHVGPWSLGADFKFGIPTGLILGLIGALLLGIGGFMFVSQHSEKFAPIIEAAALGA